MKSFILGPTSRHNTYTGQGTTKFPQAMNWYVNGKLHREGRPARVLNDGSLSVWFYEGMFHRIDGPAIVYTDTRLGTNFYYIHGVSFDKEDYWKHHLVVKNVLNEMTKL